MNQDQPVVGQVEGQKEKDDVQGVEITVKRVAGLVIAQGHPGIPERKFAVQEFGKEQFFIEIIKISGHVMVDDRTPEEGMEKINKKSQGREEINTGGQVFRWLSQGFFIICRFICPAAGVTGDSN